MGARWGLHGPLAPLEGVVAIRLPSQYPNDPHDATARGHAPDVSLAPPPSGPPPARASAAAPRHASSSSSTTSSRWSTRPPRLRATAREGEGEAEAVTIGWGAAALGVAAAGALLRRLVRRSRRGGADSAQASECGGSPGRSTPPVDRYPLGVGALPSPHSAPPAGRHGHAHAQPQPFASVPPRPTRRNLIRQIRQYAQHRESSSDSDADEAHHLRTGPIHHVEDTDSEGSEDFEIVCPDGNASRHVHANGHAVHGEGRVAEELVVREAGEAPAVPSLAVLAERLLGKEARGKVNDDSAGDPEPDSSSDEARPLRKSLAEARREVRGWRDRAMRAEQRDAAAADALRESLAEARLEVAEWRNRASRVEQADTALRESLAEARREVAEWRDRASRATQGESSAKAQLTELEKELEFSCSRAIAAEEQVESVRGELASVRSELSAARDERGEAARKRARAEAAERDAVARVRDVERRFEALARSTRLLHPRTRVPLP